MLRVEGLRIAQGDFALSADFAVERGRRVAVIGPSGAGKSTLLNALGGYIDIAAGRIEVDGRDVTDAPPDKRGVAMLFQDGNLFPHLTLAQNVGLGIRPALRLSDAETAKVHEALERVGLAEFADRKPGDVSGGQQSRAALARVLVQAKPLLLLDEPFAALGPALRIEMLDLTSQVARDAGATVLMITHAPEDAERADDLIFVEAGRVDPPRPVADVMANLPEALRAYLGR
ncbi:ATP-binding cassette domain-containing protein [Tateyamaria omphalii]|uniref:thiamine ABC transporter ATP-binding protein n=1 Tax=Tateyamaria omphalii TaxID=299262 RepID=UPI001C99FD27|nr:ATP-binding cassette domain-containing protein [Tateyamaria omphalii]MBY5933497.1 ATP-binding cassette domain-containing protein [Tateyamaria omphalii]